VLPAPPRGPVGRREVQDGPETYVWRAGPQPPSGDTHDEASPLRAGFRRPRARQERLPCEGARRPGPRARLLREVEGVRSGNGPRRVHELSGVLLPSPPRRRRACPRGGRFPRNRGARRGRAAPRHGMRVRARRVSRREGRSRRFARHGRFALPRGGGGKRQRREPRNPCGGDSFRRRHALSHGRGVRRLCRESAVLQRLQDRVLRSVKEDVA